MSNEDTLEGRRWLKERRFFRAWKASPFAHPAEILRYEAWAQMEQRIADLEEDVNRLDDELRDLGR